MANPQGRKHGLRVDDIFSPVYDQYVVSPEDFDGSLDNRAVITLSVRTLLRRSVVSTV
jgi:hypothetical protein